MSDEESLISNITEVFKKLTKKGFYLFLLETEKPMAVFKDKYFQGPLFRLYLELWTKNSSVPN